MAISFKRYVAITSGVGGGNAVRTRDLILRLFTTDPLAPVDAVIEMDSADSVAAYFGSSSPEYLRALFYFGFVSKNITAPRKISFGRYVDAASAPRIFGAKKTFALSAFTGITTGSFKLTMGGFSFDLTGLNFSGAASLAAVATILQTAVRAQTGGGTLWTSATVAYDATNGRFTLVGGATGAAVISTAAAASGTDIRTLLGWDAAGIFSPGAAQQTPAEAFSASVAISNNFLTFDYIPALVLADVTAVATVNDALNVLFWYTTGVTQANAATWYAALAGFSGVSLTLAPLSTEFPQLLPAAIAAATNYDARNSVQNFMFQQGTLTPSVTDDATADAMDAARVNYYGRTQTAGQFIQFYQRGVMMGLATDPVDMNVYANEAWLKDFAGASIMSLLLSVARVPANQAGRGQLLAVLQSVINRALFNGTISVGKPLNTTQKLYITNLTGDVNAWQQVYNAGYWLDVNLASYVTQDSRTEWKATYTLIYSKDDAIRKVEGSHVLI